MPQKPDILFIITDQQRWDSINSAKGGWGHTPHIDRLAAEGVTFEQCFCAAPSCVPSRASLFNLKWPSSMGAMKNGDQWTTSWVAHFQKAGYRTFNVGKMHTQPFDAPCGFEQRFIVENKDRFYLPRYYDDWDRHMKQLGVPAPNRAFYQKQPDYKTALGAYEWTLPKELHWDCYVANTAQWLLDEMDDSPFFMQIGFPGPHPPYDPPAEYLDKIDVSEIPLPEPYSSDDEIPPLQEYREVMMNGNHDGIYWTEHPSHEQIQRIRHHYAANVAMIDEAIGQILEKLDERGRLDNTIIVFTSDHGDALGDHRQIQKWTMQDHNTRVPAIMWAPGKLQADTRCDQLISQIDLIPMLFELAEVPLPDSGEALNANEILKGKQTGREFVYAEHGRCNMLPSIEHMAMIRTQDWKLVHYKNREYGELYDLKADPKELNNLWFSIEHQATRKELEAKVPAIH